MLKNPFGPTRVDAGPLSTPARPEMAGGGVEVRYSSTTRTLVPAALVSSGVLVPIILFFVLPAPFNALMAAVTAVMELGAAALMWLWLNKSYVRADDIGVTKSQLGKAETIAWEQIRGFEYVEKDAPAQTVYKLKDAFDKTILEFNDFGNKRDGAKLRSFIEAKLGK